MRVRILPPEEIVETVVTRLPLSKSISARAMVLAAITPDAPGILPERLASCDDIDVLSRALDVRIGTVRCGASGTAMRFLTAFYAATEGTDVILDGEEALRERPIAPLVEALQSIGASIEYLEDAGRLPLRIKGCKLKGGDVKLDASASSQFASAIALIAPIMDRPVCLDLGGEIASMPYFEMTLRMLERRGVMSERQAYKFFIENKPLQPVEAESEPDWSAASYWYEIASATAGWITIPRMLPDSLQGDSILAKIGERIGVVSEFDEDGLQLSATPDLHARLDMNMADYPDLVPALAVAAAIASMPFHLTGLDNLRVKESNRLEVLCTEMTKCGWEVRTDGESLESEATLVPPPYPIIIDPHGDHRIAMAFAAASVWTQGLIIADAECVSKSYPWFWEDLRNSGFIVEELDSKQMLE